MKTLIVHAHPEPASFTTALKDRAVAVLRDLGHEVVVSDLHAMAFKAVADASDFADRADPSYLVYAKEQRHNVEKGTLAPDVRSELDRLLEADLVILSFPLYWWSVPAILKGWIDRVLVAGRCYGGRRVYDRGGLAGRRAMLAFTCGSREHMFGPDAIHGELDVLLRPLQQGTLAYVGMTVLPPFVAHHVPYVTDEERRALLDRWEARLRALDGDRPLAFPTLDRFDAQFRPIAAAPAP